MLSCKFYEIPKKNFFYRTPPVAASESASVAQVFEQSKCPNVLSAPSARVLFKWLEWLKAHWVSQMRFACPNVWSDVTRKDTKYEKTF